MRAHTHAHTHNSHAHRWYYDPKTQLYYGDDTAHMNNVHTHAHAQTHTQTHTRAHTRTHTHRHTQTHTRAHTHNSHAHRWYYDPKTQWYYRDDTAHMNNVHTQTHTHRHTHRRTRAHTHTRTHNSHAHRWYYDPKTQWYYGGEPEPTWLKLPPLPDHAMFGVAKHLGGPVSQPSPGMCTCVFVFVCAFV